MSTNIIVLAQARTGSCLLCNIFGMLNPCRNLNELFLSHKFAEDPKNLPVVPHQYFFKILERKYLFDRLRLQNNDYVGLLKHFSSYPEETINLLDQIIPATKIIKILDDLKNKLLLEIYS